MQCSRARKCSQRPFDTPTMRCTVLRGCSNKCPFQLTNLTELSKRKIIIQCPCHKAWNTSDTKFSKNHHVQTISHASAKPASERKHQAEVSLLSSLPLGAISARMFCARSNCKTNRRVSVEWKFCFFTRGWTFLYYNLLIGTAFVFIKNENVSHLL